MEESIFTKIIKGEVPCHKIYEDDFVIVFLDINPLNDGHALVVPKIQTDHLWDLPDDVYKHVLEIVKKVALKQREIINPKRVGIMVEGFEIPHAHIHVVPMYKGIRATLAQQKTTAPNHEKLADLANKLKISGK